MVWLGLSWTGLCLAQDYPIIKYTTREGLGQNQVLTVLKDSRGYVWCGTWNGVSKFNGETFENYSLKEGFWNGSVTDIQEDKDGYIWFLNAGGIIARFDGRTFKKYQAPYPFSGIIITRQNKIQVTTIGPLLELQGDTLLPAKWIKNLPNDIGYAYHKNSDSYLIIGAEKIYSYQQGKRQTLVQRKDWSVREPICGDIHLLKQSITNEQEYYIWNGQALLPHLKLSPKNITVLRPLTYDFVFTHQDQLYYLPANSYTPESLGKNPPMSGNYQFLNQTASSLLWLPTEKGLWGLVRNGFKSFPEEQVPYTWSVVEQKNGEHLFLNYRVSLQSYNGKNVTILPKNYSRLLNKASQIQKFILPNYTDQWYYHALRDQFGAVWLPESDGLFRYANKQWQYFRTSKGYPLAFCLAEDKKRHKVVAASKPYFYTVETQPPYRTDSIRGQAPLFDNLLICNVVAPNGDYWFSGLGVECYHPDTKQFTSYTKENGKLPVKGGNVLYFDWNGDLWFGGRETICRYNPKTDSFERVLEGYFSQLIQFFEQIDSTHLMIADSYNLYVLDLKLFNEKGKVSLKCFNHHNGFMGLEPGQLGSYRDSKGKIWVTSSSVLSVVDPKKLDLKVLPLQTFIRQINDESLPFVGQGETIALPFGDNNVTIRVESIGEDKPFRSQFSYRLLDVNEVWSVWQDTPIINLSNLPNGLHTLQVRSRTGAFQITESSVTSVKFVTKVNFWKSPNFYWYASWAGLGAVSLLALLWWRDRQNSKRLLGQQKQIEERERQMRLLQAQTIQSQMNPHFTSNALAAIQKLILQQDSERASDNLIKMGRLTRAYLEDSLFKEEKMPHAREISLTRELDLLKMYIELMQLQYEKRFEVEFNLDGALNTDNFRLPPFLIQPFVENAIVHGLLNKVEKGHLKLHFFTLSAETLVCKVEDDGIGRAAAQALQLHKPKTQSSVSTTLTQQRILLLNQLGYHIEIKIEDSLKNTGTIVTIQLNNV